MVKYIKPKAPTRREIRVAEREAKRARRVGPRSPRPKSPTLSKPSSFRGSLNELDDNVSPILIVRSPSPGGSPRRRGAWSRPGSPTGSRPMEALQLMANCIQFCNDNLEQMRQVSQRLESLRDGSSSPNLGTSPDLKRRSQLMQKKHGGISPPLSPSSSFGLIQTSSVLLDGKRSLLGSSVDHLCFSSGSMGVDNSSDTSVTKTAANVLPDDIKDVSGLPASTQRQQLTSSDVPRVSSSKSPDIANPSSTRAGSDSVRRVVISSQRAAPRRQSSSSSLSSNAATVGLAGTASTSSGAVPVANMNSTRQISSKPTSNVQESKARAVSGSSAGDSRTWTGRAPPPARKVASARVAAPRPAPVRSSTPTTDATIRPECPSGAKLNAARTTTARRDATASPSRASSRSAMSATPQPSRSVDNAKAASGRLNRATPSPTPTVSRVSPRTFTEPTVPATATPLTQAPRQPISRPPSVTGQPRPPTASKRARTASSPMKVPTAGICSRTASGPQIVISPAEDSDPPRPSASTASASSVTTISTSASRAPLSGSVSSYAVATGCMSEKTSPIAPAVRASKVHNNSDGSGARRPRQPLGATPRSPGSPNRSVVGNTNTRDGMTLPSVSAQMRPNVKPSAGGSGSTGTQRASGIRTTPASIAEKPVLPVASANADGSAAPQSKTGRPIPVFTLDRKVPLSRRDDSTASVTNTRRRPVRPYHIQAQNKLVNASSAPPSSDISHDGFNHGALQEHNAETPFKSSPSLNARATTGTPRDMDTFDMAEIKACLFGHTASTGPPRARTAALRYWLYLLPGVSALFKTAGSIVTVDMDARPQIFAVRRPAAVSPVSRSAIIAFMQSRPVPQPTLIVSRRFSNVPVERYSMEIMPSPEPLQTTWSPVPPATGLGSALRSPVQVRQMPEVVEDVFFPGGPFVEVTEAEKMSIPPPGMQRPHRQHLQRALNQMARFGTPTRMPHLTRPLVGSSSMDAVLAALEAQTFDSRGAPYGAIGGLGHRTYARRALIRLLKTAYRAVCRNATKLVLSPWRLVLQVLLRK